MGTPRYSKEFKAEAVRLFKAGNKPVTRLAKELGVAAGSIRQWARQIEVDAGPGGSGALTTAEREELSALRKNNRELERERDFLQQAAAYFAKSKK